MNIPNNVKMVMNTLEGAGFQAFVVGGAVRDTIAGFPVKDWDVASDAQPEQVIEVFENFKVIPTGIEHGTVTVMVDGEGIEVTTFRADVGFDGGHQCDVEFVQTIEEDMSRRDFTMNAIAVDVRGNMVDPFGGVEDINRRIIRFVGDANERIVEDPLRMMRAIRFVAQKNFAMHWTVKVAIADNANLIENVSAERITDEVRKMVVANPAVVSTMWEHGLLAVIMPEVDVLFDTVQNNPHHRFWMVGNHTIVAMMSIANRFDLRMAMMFHDIGKAVTKSTDEDGVDHFFGHADVSAHMAVDIMRRMKMDNDTIKKIKVMVREHGREIATTKKSVKRAIRAVGADNFVDLIAVKVADDMAKDTNREDVQNRIDDAEILIDIFNEVMEEEEAFDRSGLAVNGHDMMAIGFEGRGIREVLNVLVDRVIDNPDLNNREDLMEIAFNWFVN